MIPFLDLKQAYRELKPQLDSAIQRVVESGVYILGDEVERFEDEFSTYCSSAYAVGVANGLDALILSLRALNIGPGDEVIVPSNTFIATWLAVSAVGAQPVPVEPVPSTYNIDPQLLDAALTRHTKAVIAVHLYGQPAELDALTRFTRQNGLYLIEDAAQAHGARYRGTRIGAHGDLVCWSFYPAKNLGALGDGGAVTSDNAELVERIRVLRNYGSREKYKNEVLGTNSRLDPIQAAVLRVKLKYLDEWNERRREIASHYIQELSNLDIVLPEVPEWAEPVWHLFVIRARKRSSLQEILLTRGISTQIHYPIAPARQTAYEGSVASLFKQPLAEQISREVLSLPIGPHQNSDDTSRIVTTIREVIASL
jgi:dTDP-4-amino-4,6-dideoxygalactose transaminase